MTTDKPSAAAMDDMRDPDVASAMRAEESSAGTTDKPSAGELKPCPFCNGNAAAMENYRGHWQTSCTECHAGTPHSFDTRELANIAWNRRPPVAGAEVGVMRQACDWPAGLFSFFDEPGAHDPCYVVMPGGASLELNHHAGEGVDIARAKFIIDACNAVLTGEADRWFKVAKTEALGRERMSQLAFGRLSPPVAERGVTPNHILAEIVERWNDLKRDEGAFPSGDRRAAMSEHRLWHAIQQAKAWLSVAERGGGGAGGDNDIGVLLAALRNFEDAVGEEYDDEGGTIAQIEADYLARIVTANEPSPTPETGDGSETIGGGR